MPFIPAAAQLSSGGTGEVAYAQTIADVTITSTTEASPTDVLSLGAVNYNGTPIVLEFYAATVGPAGGTTLGFILELWDDTTYLCRVFDSRLPGMNDAQQGVSISHRLVPSAGLHTYKIRGVKNPGTGNPTLFSGTGSAGTGTYCPIQMRARSAPLSSGGGGLVIFDSTLGADTASIDTGANAIPAGLGHIEILILARTDSGAAIVAGELTFNNDSSAIYDSQSDIGNNVTPSAGSSLAQTSIGFNAHGTAGSASYACLTRAKILGYDQTTFWKTIEATTSNPDATANNNFAVQYSWGYRSTAAINRVKIAAGGAAKFVAGSRLQVIGYR